MKSPDPCARLRFRNLAALVGTSIFLIPLALYPQTRDDPFASPGRDSSSHASAPTSEVSVVPVEEMNPAERQEYRVVTRQIDEARRLIEEAQRLAQVQDGRSALDGRRIDNSATRRTGEERIADGQRRVEQGEARLKDLYRRVAKRQAEHGQRMQEARFREWVDNDGRRIRASFVGIVGQAVILLRDDGQEFRIPFSTLSRSDAAYAQLLGSGHEFDEEGLLAAIRAGQSRAVEQYFDAGLALAETTPGDALVAAVEIGNEPLLEMLLAKGINASDYSRDGVRPLSEAVRRQRGSFVEILLNAGASPLEGDVTDEGVSPMGWALMQGNRDYLRLFSQKGFELGPRTQQAVNLVLNGVVGSIPPRVMEMLMVLEHGGVLEGDEAARVELFLAGQLLTIDGFLAALVRGDNPEHILWYCRAGIVAEAVENEWARLTRVLAGRGDFAIEEMLDCHGVPPKKGAEVRLLTGGFEVNPDGLRDAITQGDAGAVRNFLLAGVSPVAKASDGEIVMVHAFRQDDPAINRILLESGLIEGREIAGFRLAAGGEELQDPEGARLELMAAGKALDESQFRHAIAEGDLTSLTIFGRAGAAEHFDLRYGSPIWESIWPVSTPSTQKVLLTMADLSESERVLLQVHLADISHQEALVLSLGNMGLPGGERLPDREAPAREEREFHFTAQSAEPGLGAGPKGFQPAAEGGLVVEGTTAEAFQATLLRIEQEASLEVAQAFHKAMEYCVIRETFLGGKAGRPAATSNDRSTVRFRAKRLEK